MIAQTGNAYMKVFWVHYEQHNMLLFGIARKPFEKPRR